MSAEFDMGQVDALAADLTAAGPKVEQRTENDVLAEAGRKLQEAAKRDAPVRTGELRDSIYLRGGKGYREVGSDVDYAYYVEFGSYKDSPQPFLYPNVAGIEREMFEALDDIGDPFA